MFIFRISDSCFHSLKLPILYLTPRGQASSSLRKRTRHMASEIGRILNDEYVTLSE
jgi:hypothetical protein